MKNKNLSSKLFKVAMASSLAAGALVVTAPVNSDAAVTGYKDLLPTSDHYEPVLDLTNRGVIQGYEDGTFRPNASVTRGQAAKIIAMALKLDTVNVKNPGFKDISTKHAYYGPIAALVEAGIITGFPEDNTFRSGDTLTRAQMSKIIALAYKLPEPTTIDHKFTDVKAQNWYNGYVQTLVNLDITKGTTPTTFEPGSPVRRGQLASFVVRTEKKLAPVIPAPTPTPVIPEGNTPLNNAIKTAFDTIANPVPTKVDLKMTGNSFEVTIKDDATTFVDFRSAAQGVFDVFKADTVVDSVKVTVFLPNGDSASISDPAVTNYNNLDIILENALKKVGLEETDSIAFLKDMKVSFDVKGKYTGKDFNDSYTFDFK